MSPDEALGLIQSLKTQGTELRQRGRLLHIESRPENITARLSELISRNWAQVALAASAHRQAERLILSASRRRATVTD